jgi:hypothetical protein
MSKHLGLFFIVLVLISCNTQVTPSFTFSGALPMSVAKTIIAGSQLAITVGPSAAPKGLSVTLVVTGSYGPRMYQTTFQRDEAHFLLPGKETQQAGIVGLTALAGQSQGSAQVLIQASSPVEPLTPLVGVRSIIADRYSWSMTVLVPFDKFGNPVMEGTRVEVLILHPGNRLEKKFLVVRHLLAWMRVFSGIKAGRSTVVALLGQVYGFEARLLEVAGWPTPFSISADPPSLPADGYLLTTLQTSIIRDQFGNAMPDGTLITFVIDSPDGTRTSIPAQTIDGSAGISFQAPREEGAYQIRASVFGVESQLFVMHFTAGPAVGTFPIIGHQETINQASLLIAGPLLGTLGQYIPDGSPVRFLITPAHGQSQELDTVSDAGYAQVEMLLAQFPAGLYSIRVVVGSGTAQITFMQR